MVFAVGQLCFPCNQIVAVNVTENTIEVELPPPSMMKESDDTFDVTYTYSVEWSENKE